MFGAARHEPRVRLTVGLVWKALMGPGARLGETQIGEQTLHSRSRLGKRAMSMLHSNAE